jgi:DNA-binding XRE family transcriptional regulator
LFLRIYKWRIERYNEIVTHNWIEYHFGEGEKNMDNKTTTPALYDIGNLGIRLYELRRRQKLTVEQLAEMVDVSSRFITQIESGERYGSIPTLIKIANALNVSLGSLFQ